jgi:hypothetical protein
MTSIRVKTFQKTRISQSKKLNRWWIAGGILALSVVIAGIIFASSPPSTEAPEAKRILEVQARMPFQIIIPAYMPNDFDRGNVGIDVSGAGPGGEPMAQLTYATRSGASLFVKEWVPVNPDKEILNGSRPVQTRWGKGWMLTQPSLVALWVDVGPMRVSLYTQDLNMLSREDVLQMGDTLGPPSNDQVFSFSVDKPTVKDVLPPPPVEIQPNAQGVQEVTLVITPGGYTPLRFALKKGVPARLIFRQLGAVGCGNELIFPADPQNPSELRLKSANDQQVLEWTPQVTGEFKFVCSHDMYRGIMTVHE